MGSAALQEDGVEEFLVGRAHFGRVMMSSGVMEDLADECTEGQC